MIALTGATGTVGRELVRLLVDRGERPRVLSRDPAAAWLAFGDAVEHVPADLDRPGSLPAALAGAHRLFVLTPPTSRQPDRERHLVTAAVAAGVAHVVKTSVFRADPASRLRLARQHGRIEAAIARTPVRWTFLRPTFFMQNLTGQVLNGVLVGATRQGRVGMVDARDVAAAAAAALTAPAAGNRVHTLTGPRTLSLRQAAEIISVAGGTRCGHREVAPQQVRAAMLRSGAEAWFATDMARLHTMLAGGYEDLVTADLDELTGQPGRDLADFAEDMLAAPEVPAPATA
jgi:uncharacterized protein YbjT (DUF2867 family)